MIKLIASDIDGTLVKDGDNKLNPELFDVILKLRAKGIQFAAASGRQWASIENIFEPIKKKIFYLSDNGAYVGCCGRNLFIHNLDKTLAYELVDDIRATDGLEVLVGCADKIYMESSDEELVSWLIDGYKFNIERVEDVLQVKDNIIKVSAYCRTDIQAATKELNEKYKDRMQVAIAGDMWMDCMAKGVNKGNAIRILQESLDISPRETMVFGDQLNDIEMLGQAYYSFAVENAKDEVKKAARFQTDTNINDGVLKILRNLL